MHQNPGNRARRCARSGAVRYGIMRAVRRGASFGLSFEFLSDPWLCAHQQATGKVNPATVQRRSAAVADAFTPPFTPVSSAPISMMIDVDVFPPSFMCELSAL